MDSLPVRGSLAKEAAAPASDNETHLTERFVGSSAVLRSYQASVGGVAEATPQ
jgi:hypothetical protein